jgi:hypothetical protein
MKRLLCWIFGHIESSRYTEGTVRYRVVYCRWCGKEKHTVGWAIGSHRGRELL